MLETFRGGGRYGAAAYMADGGFGGIACWGRGSGEHDLSRSVNVRLGSPPARCVRSETRGGGAEEDATDCRGGTAAARASGTSRGAWESYEYLETVLGLVKDEAAAQ